MTYNIHTVLLASQPASQPVCPSSRIDGIIIIVIMCLLQVKMFFSEDPEVYGK